MKNFIQCGETLTLTAPYTAASGAGTLLGAIFGVATNDVTSGSVGEYVTEGVFSLAKVSAQAWATVGLKIYWDDTAKNCTTTSAGNTLIGVNTAVAANPSSTGYVRLNGSF